MSNPQEDLWTAVRLMAEGSDWNRDQGETLTAWVQRRLRAPVPEARRSEWNDALDKALLAVEAEQAKYIVARSGDGAAAVRGALEYAMTAIRGLKHSTMNRERT
jgi:hypothetical protein